MRPRSSLGCGKRHSTLPGPDQTTADRIHRRGGWGKAAGIESTRRSVPIRRCPCRRTIEFDREVETVGLESIRDSDRDQQTQGAFISERGLDRLALTLLKDHGAGIGGAPTMTPGRLDRGPGGMPLSRGSSVEVPSRGDVVLHRQCDSLLRQKTRHPSGETRRPDRFPSEELAHPSRKTGAGHGGRPKQAPSRPDTSSR